ncbi:flavin monoamine oxidase family protein [Komagataeibacter xylinus]|uniref:Tryptophan 2-monooxygenase n=1 Tax=Komagataeibacter xylinus TaxID=28448 RepID=A0A857FQ35_KOMXY|nr:flavin monoamine oxidase family protein [Komagataeibacter xylinus]QHC35310.1 flavin monoamine oxidase family protein [Komagataeibacter xylinus]
MPVNPSGPTRRDLLLKIGLTAGTAAMYQAMTALGHAAESQFSGTLDLGRARRGDSVVVLGAGLAGLAAAYELDKAGYKVRLLEYQDRAGGRNWTLRGGDTYTELGGATQKVAFAAGNYFNPGPWRIPHHHRAILHYCKQFGVQLEPFIQFNNNAYVHSTNAFGGKPQRYRDAASDFIGNISELLGKSVNQNNLDQVLTKDDRERLLVALREWGMLDASYSYRKGLHVSSRRGYDRPPGGGPDGAPIASDLLPFTDVLDPCVWNTMKFFMTYEMQPTMFQPVGGMDMIGKAFARRIGRLITFNRKVTAIDQDSSGVTISHTDRVSGAVGQTKADWCVCAMPLTVLAQIPVQVSPKMQAGIRAVPYSSHAKIGMEFRRRFWEEDEAIYGGISFTSQEIALISYPNDRMHSSGPAVLLGGFPLSLAGLDFAAMTPEQRLEAALRQGEVIHPQYRSEFMNGTSVAWSRVPWMLGCRARWSEADRKAYYQDLVAVDGRIVLAGDHASYLGGWQEGALLSSMDAVKRLHKRAQEA